MLSSVKAALAGLRKYLAPESPLKMMKNAFYFALKAFFILKIFRFLSWIFGLIRKIKLISKFMTSQPG